MSAGKMNVEIVKGKTFRKVFQIFDGTPTGQYVSRESIAKDIADGVIVVRNLAGSTFTAKALINGVVITFAATVIDENAVQILYTKEQTTSIAGSKGVWDCTQVFPNGEAVLIVEGNVNVTKAVS